MSSAGCPTCYVARSILHMQPTMRPSMPRAPGTVTAGVPLEVPVSSDPCQAGATLAFPLGDSMGLMTRPQTFNWDQACFLWPLLCRVVDSRVEGPHVAWVSLTALALAGLGRPNRTIDSRAHALTSINYPACLGSSSHPVAWASNLEPHHGQRGGLHSMCDRRQ